MTQAPNADTNLTSWLHYIANISPKEIELGLERVSVVAKRLNLSKLRSCVITVAGTNGKGSCVKTLESIYLAAGYRVAASTSPHLIHFNERLRIDGHDIETPVLCRAFASVESAREQLLLSYFEFVTLAILLCIEQAEVDIALLEVGLGGRLDAVNVVDADLAVITNIDLDHTDYLGDTREQIGFEKAGIFRANQLAVCGDPDPPQSIAKCATAVGAQLYQVGEHFNSQSSGERWDFLGQLGDYQQLPQAGLKQQNIVSALACVQLLQQQFPVSESCVVQALSSLKLAGRYEVHVAPQRYIFDVAHNPQALAWLVQQVQSLNIGRVHVVVGMMADKDLANGLRILAEIASVWYVTSIPDNPRAATAAQLMSQIRAFCTKSCYNFSNVADAFNAANAQRRPGDWIVVCGSFCTVGAAKHSMQQSMKERL